ncbi:MULTISPECIES: pseudouridine synthase [Bacillaceae]|uniref:pseudouridine synthase n=1 Tax=Bacillaceae TaxID=186817 RepID=UPI000BA59407|nr:pseudouridine synthase [Virgibacillus sp. 7505]PAE16876.1 pseudouridine synthase [Virgibacillus sp. 7505]
MDKQAERLQKVIAHSGITSRRKAETMILEGKVKVNGKVVKELGIKVTDRDTVEVNGIPLEKEKSVYYMLYKPRGVISSVQDEKDRKVVLDLMPEVLERVYPIGRLDYDTSGLLLLTNDGEFANMLMHPSQKIDKVYVAKVKGIPTPDELKQLKRGIMIDGHKCKAVYAKLMSADRKKNTSLVQIILHEGRNRQVRKMMERIQFPVQKLKRERYGFLTLEGLQPGAYRKLTPEEVHRFKMEYKEKSK